MDPGYWAGRAVLITGHTGFKGAWLTALLARLGAVVHGYALSTPPEFLFQRAHLADDLASDTRADIRDDAALEAALATARPDVVLHLAAQTVVRRSYDDPREAFSTNVDGTLSVLAAARGAASVSRVVVVTTDKVYRNQEWPWGYREVDPLGGDDPYSASKAACEVATHSFAVSFPRDGFAVATARAGNVVGGGDATPDALVPELMAAYAAGRPARLRRPHATRPWQHVLEPLQGYLTLAEHLDAGHHDSSWNFGPDDGGDLEVGEVASRAAAAWGGGASWVDEDDGGPHEAGRLMVDSAKARAGLGWRPVLDADAAIGMTVEWHRRVLAGESPRRVTDEQVDEYLRRGGLA